MAMQCLGRLACCLLMLAAASVASPAIAQSPPPAELERAQTAQQPAMTTATALEHRNTILEAKADLREEAYAQLEVLLVLLTLAIGVLVIFFSFHTKDIALAQVKMASADLWREIHAEQRKIETHGKEIDTLLAQARADTAQVRRHLTEVANTVGFGSATATQTATIAALAAALRDKNLRELEGGEIAVLIADADLKGDIAKLHDRAVALRQLFPEPQWQALALFAEGLVAGKTRAPEDAIKIYDMLIARFDHSDDPSVRENVAKAKFNRAVRLGNIPGREAEELAQYDALVAEEGHAESKVIQRVVSNALYNKGLTQFEARNYAQAIETFDDLRNRCAESTDPGCLENAANGIVLVARAHGERGNVSREIELYAYLVERFAKSDSDPLLDVAEEAQHFCARRHALDGKAAECVAALEHYATLFGSLDHDALAKDAGFDRVRADPAFLALMQRHPPRTEAR